MPGCQLHVPALTWQIRLVGVAAGCVGGPDLALGEDCWDTRWPQGVLPNGCSAERGCQGEAAPQAHRLPGLLGPSLLMASESRPVGSSHGQRSGYQDYVNWQGSCALLPGRLTQPTRSLSAVKACVELVTGRVQPTATGAANRHPPHKSRSAGGACSITHRGGGSGRSHIREVVGNVGGRRGT
jgi:hypothetical protein